MQGLTSSADLNACADRIVTALREPHRVGSEEVVATVSIGIAATSRTDHLPEDLLREADLAMYRAKDGGGTATRSTGRRSRRGPPSAS